MSKLCPDHFKFLQPPMIKGGTHASMLSLENPDQIVNIAPAEGQKPLFIISDPKFDLMCYPDNFCFGEGSFGKERERKITYRKFQCSTTGY